MKYINKALIFFVIYLFTPSYLLASSSNEICQEAVGHEIENKIAYMAGLAIIFPNNEEEYRYTQQCFLKWIKGDDVILAGAKWSVEMALLKMMIVAPEQFINELDNTNQLIFEHWIKSMNILQRWPTKCPRHDIINIAINVIDPIKLESEKSKLNKNLILAKLKTLNCRSAEK
jgi:hypothetical protein